MQLSHLPPALLGLLALSPTAIATTIALHISPSHALANPHLLPPSTHATLTAAQALHRAPLGTSNTLIFHNISAGSYLLDVHCATHAFVPLRVDVDVSDTVGDSGVVRAWETYRGNDWDNTGEALALQDGAFEARVLGLKAYFSERSGFSVFGVLRNPMILLGLVSMGIFIGMPYLVDNSELPPFSFFAFDSSWRREDPDMREK